MKRAKKREEKETIDDVPCEICSDTACTKTNDILLVIFNINFTKANEHYAFYALTSLGPKHPPFEIDPPPTAFLYPLQLRSAARRMAWRVADAVSTKNA